MAQESTSSEKKVYLQCEKLIDNGVADDDLFVVFISNEAKKIPVWNRKGSNIRDGRVVRDYHVFCIQRIKDGESEDLVWDLDSKPPVPSTLSSYISESIRPSYKLFAEFQRVFNVVHAPVFLCDFASDWRHMKVSKENWTSTPESEVRVAESEVIVAEAFSEHFTKEGMIPLVEYNAKKIFEVKVKEMKTAITTKISEEAEISEVTKITEQHIKRNDKLLEIDVVRILWDVLMDAVQWSWKNQQEGKNQQEIGDLVLHQVKTWAKLLKEFCTTGELQLELLYNVQVECYEDTKLMNLFPEIVRNLYDEDVLAKDTILHWFRKGTNQEGRKSFVKALEPMVKWLGEAEEEE